MLNLPKYNIQSTVTYVLTTTLVVLLGGFFLNLPASAQRVSDNMEERDLGDVFRESIQDEIRDDVRDNVRENACERREDRGRDPDLCNTLENIDDVRDDVRGASDRLDAIDVIFD